MLNLNGFMGYEEKDWSPSHTKKGYFSCTKILSVRILKGKILVVKAN